MLVHREMPLSLIDIDNMRRATEAGAVICPANPGFYFLPQNIGDLVDFVVAGSELWSESERLSNTKHCRSRGSARYITPSLGVCKR